MTKYFNNLRYYRTWAAQSLMRYYRQETLWEVVKTGDVMRPAATHWDRQETNLLAYPEDFVSNLWEKTS
jgi:hypothetical protein